MNRRAILKLGTAAGLCSPDWLNASLSNPKAQNVIHIFLPGGIAHQDTWDYKPYNAPEYKGPFLGIKTKIDDVIFSSLLERTASISDKITVIRSMTHNEAAHERGVHNMLTGYRPNPSIQYPSFGSIISHELGPQHNLPSYVLVPSQFAPENGTGYLSTKYGPFSLGSNPEDPNFKVRDLTVPLEITQDHLNRRKNLLKIIDDNFQQIAKSDAVDAMSSFYEKAFGLISSKHAQDAFNLSDESDHIKELYGKNAAGMRFLMARRLVEVGVRMVTVNYGSWDHHNNIRDSLLSQTPNFDKAFAALITDLHERGLLKSTLVMVTSEFGRTPKINNTNGRDHWPSVFSIVLAGGGLKPGTVYGKSNALSSEPEENPVTPEDLAATMYHLMGIDYTKKLSTSDLRPIDIVKDGSVLKDILL